MDRVERRPVRPRVAGHRGAEGRLGVLERAVGALRPALERLARGRRQVRQERLVAILRVAREAAVDAAPPLGQVGASPVQDRQDVDHAVARLQVGLHGVRQRHARVGAELRVLFRGVAPHVAAGHDPQHVVFVQGDVPLHVAGAVLQDVLVVVPQRRRDRRVHVAVPLGRPVVGYRVAHHHHLGYRRVRQIEQGAGHAMRALVQPDLHGPRRAAVDALRERPPAQVQPRLAVGHPHPPRGLAVRAGLRPDSALHVHQPLVSLAHRVQVAGRDYPAHDQVALLKEAAAVDPPFAHGVSFPRPALQVNGGRDGSRAALPLTPAGFRA